jgi:large subunit ribosomal protein L44e
MVGGRRALNDLINMKLPKEKRRYCPYCRKHTEQQVLTAKQKGRSSSHPLSRGGEFRARKRGLRMGYGNKGKWGSKPAIKSWKRKVKVTKKISILYKCKACGKMKGISKGIRSSRIEIGEKVSK